MQKIIMYLFVAFAGTGFYSCKSSKILSATFESDAINNPPATNLPGDPTGDVIEYNPAIAPQLSVQNSATAGEKALHFINAPIVGEVSGHHRWLGFKGVGTNLVKTVWFTHTAKNINPSGDLLIDVSDGHGYLMARMRIKANGEVGLAKNILDPYTDVIGTLSPNGHTIVFTTTPSDLKYNVTIFQTSGGAITATDKPMITENALMFANPAHPSISFQHSENPNVNHKYIIESVSISRKKP